MKDEQKNKKDLERVVSLYKAAVKASTQRPGMKVKTGLLGGGEATAS